MKLVTIRKNDPKPGVVLPSIAPGEVVVGLDEVGRGAWAGPLLVAAVILANGAPEGTTDSKQLSPARRQELARQIKQAASSIGLGWVSAPELDHLGLGPALKLAARKAVAALTCPYDLIIIDGTINFLPGHRVETLAKADFLIPAVAAASIVAKVARDSYMHQLHKLDPRYGFDQHVGYGTPGHISQLALHGPSLHHRYSFKPIRELAS